jgi:uncharacterized protein YecT (DUF1311 family)
MIEDTYFRLEVAQKQMERALAALKRSGWMSVTQQRRLELAKVSWSKYAEDQARFAASAFEGGSMETLVYASELEVTTISRVGALKRIHEEMRERREGE